jgi:hypothetical protein
MTSSDKPPVETAEEGQLVPPGLQQLPHQGYHQVQQQHHQPLPQRQQQNDQPLMPSTERLPDAHPVAQSGTTSSEMHSNSQLASANTPPAPSEMKNSLAGMSTATGEPTLQNVRQPPTQPIQNTSGTQRKSGPRNNGTGYERKIGRGTSWRRDHERLEEEDYTVRGRGRGSAPARGRGHFHREFEPREPYRRDYDRRPLPMDTRPQYPADPYYDPRGSYAPPFDARRDYPTDPSRYFDDYRRGYDPRDLPPPSAPVDSRPYDRGMPRGRASSEYGRPYSRPRDPHDGPREGPRDLRDVPRDPRDAPRDPRDPVRDPRDDFRADPRISPSVPRYSDEGIQYDTCLISKAEILEDSTMRGCCLHPIGEEIH